MIATACKHEQLAKHGKDRKGCQRWKCRQCGMTVTKADYQRPLGDMRIDQNDAEQVLRMILEGMSIRACERITGVKDTTICNLVLTVGEKCNAFLERTVRNVEAKRIELDEIWGFVFCKNKHAQNKHPGVDGIGDAWTWFAIDADSKLILSHATGKRDEATCDAFLSRLNNATVGRCQVTADGLSLYTHRVPMTLGSRCDFAQLVKTYKSEQQETRYSPATITNIEKIVRFGNPDESKISTSYSERFNLTVRMQNRRMTRLTNAHSKKAEHHAAMMSLTTAYYNFCRKHETLKGRTPAQAAGLTDRVWTLKELLAKVAG
jgi:transposase-like protein/IS1 family transposase